MAVHGDPDSFYVFHHGSWVAVKPNSLRTWLRRQPGYRGQKIRLISCEAGAHNRAVAQSFSNGMGVEVKAATEPLWVHDDGRMVIGADPHVPSTGKFEDFAPFKKGDAATTVEPAPRPEDPATAARADDPGTTRGDDQGPRPGELSASDPIPKGDQLAPDLAEGASSFSTAQKSGGAQTDALPPRKSNGQFVDGVLEAKFQEYRTRKKKKSEHPRGRKEWKQRSDWWKEQSPIARGNKFNASVRQRQLYTYSEVHLVDGTRLDSYEHDGRAERVSRKATDFMLISDAEFTAYVLEINTKYPEGKLIKSRTYKELNGERLRGVAVLEVPAINLAPTDPVVVNDPVVLADLNARRARFEKIAADNKVELRYTFE